MATVCFHCLEKSSVNCLQKLYIYYPQKNKFHMGLDCVCVCVCVCVCDSLHIFPEVRKISGICLRFSWLALACKSYLPCWALLTLTWHTSAYIPKDVTTSDPYTHNRHPVFHTYPSCPPLCTYTLCDNLQMYNSHATAWVTFSDKETQLEHRVVQKRTIKARFSKQGKLAWDRNPIKVPKGVENSAGDLLTLNKLNNTDIARSFL